MKDLTLSYRPTTTKAAIIKYLRNIFQENQKMNLTSPMSDCSEPTLYIVKSKESPVYQDENNTVFGIYRYGGHEKEGISTTYKKQHLLSEIYVAPTPISHFPLFFIVFENAYFPGKLDINNPYIETNDNSAIQTLYDTNEVPKILRPRGFSFHQETAEEKARNIALERMHVYARKLDVPTLNTIIEE